MKISFITLGDVSQIATMKRALGMANPLSKLGWEVSLVVLNCKENRERIALECNSDIAVEYYNQGSLLNEIIQKSAIVNKINPDYIYYCSFSLRNMIFLNPFKGIKKIVEHSELASSIPDNKGLKKTIYKFFELFSIYHSNVLVCASRYLYEYFGKEIDKRRKGKVLNVYSPYAYSKDIIFSEKILSTHLQEKYSSKKIFLYMGTLTANYGLFTMLEAAKMLSQQRNDFKLLLLGRGRHFKEAADFVSDNRLENYVELLGYVEEKHLSSYFDLASAFISPLSNTIQDIARCPSKIYMYIPFKKPILTCMIGEPKEIFSENGHYFEFDKPDTLNKLMDKICFDINLPVSYDIESHSWESRSKSFHDAIDSQISS